ncbi:hypothetical protein BJF90_06285 [Pseudonocardia sp. CNS-004]|nr:hypothetical protein BJF90_06285 [Pseudonocardia sp. CNS-004]
MLLATGGFGPVEDGADGLRRHEVGRAVDALDLAVVQVSDPRMSGLRLPPLRLAGRPAPGTTRLTLGLPDTTIPTASDRGAVVPLETDAVLLLVTGDQAIPPPLQPGKRRPEYGVLLFGSGSRWAVGGNSGGPILVGEPGATRQELTGIVAGNNKSVDGVISSSVGVSAAAVRAYLRASGLYGVLAALGEEGGVGAWPRPEPAAPVPVGGRETRWATEADLARIRAEMLVHPDGHAVILLPEREHGYALALRGDPAGLTLVAHADAAGIFWPGDEADVRLSTEQLVDLVGGTPAYVTRGNLSAGPVGAVVVCACSAGADAMPSRAAGCRAGGAVVAPTRGRARAGTRRRSGVRRLGRCVGGGAAGRLDGGSRSTGRAAASVRGGVWRVPAIAGTAGRVEPGGTACPTVAAGVGHGGCGW